MENKAKDHTKIKGWGIDVDPKNDPTYPYRNRSEETHEGYNWERPTQQPVNVEVLHSNERPNITAVFGNTVPPSGLSGSLRRFAFQYSENTFTHWLSLVFADRINEVEGVIDDLKKGHIPNVFAEKGWNAEWKYNPKGLITKVVATTVVTSALIALLTRKK
jgi:hypothetical protein